MDILSDMEQDRLEIIKKHIDNGVIFKSTDCVYVSSETIIGEGTTIDCNNIFRGKCVIGKCCYR